MAKTYTTKNPAHKGIAAREFSFPVPEEGEIFRESGGGNYGIFIMQNGIPKSIGLPIDEAMREKIGKAFGMEASRVVKQTSGVWRSNDSKLHSIFSELLGTDVKNLPEYNIGDVTEYARSQVKGGTSTAQWNQMIEGAISPAEALKTGSVGGFAPPAAPTEAITGEGARTFKDVPGWGETTATASTGTMTSEQAAQSAMARTSKKMAEISNEELTNEEKAAFGLPTTPATATTKTMGKELPFPTTQDQMVQYQEENTYDKATKKWYEGKGTTAQAEARKELPFPTTQEQMEEYQKENIYDRATKKWYSGKDVATTDPSVDPIIDPSVDPTIDPIIDPTLSTGDDRYDKMLEVLQSYLDELVKRGDPLPPAEPTADDLANFLKQAESEIDPFYSTQLKLARESLLRDVGYSTQEILNKEKELEITYGRGVRELGEGFADVGFAQSGLRKRAEAEYAGDVQRQIETGRRELEQAAGTAGRQFAQLWGGQALGTPTIAGAPSVAAGVGAFERPSTEKPLYTISPDVYEGLVGSKEYEQKTAERTRAAELESAWRVGEEIKTRQLNL